MIKGIISLHIVHSMHISGRSPALRESVTELFIGRKVDHENRPHISTMSASQDQVIYLIFLTTTDYKLYKIVIGLLTKTLLQTLVLLVVMWLIILTSDQYLLKVERQ